MRSPDDRRDIAVDTASLEASRLACVCIAEMLVRIERDTRYTSVVWSLSLCPRRLRVGVLLKVIALATPGLRKRPERAGRSLKTRGRVHPCTRPRFPIPSMGRSLGAQDQPSSFSTIWGAALAWASIAVPACCRICSWVIVVISEAMSTSLMRLFDADRLVSVAEMASEVYWRRFCTAPSVAARAEMLVMAVSSWVSVPVLRSNTWALEEPTFDQQKPVVPRPVAPSTSAKVVVRVSVPLAPTWKVTEPLVPAEPLSRFCPLNWTAPRWRSISLVSWSTSFWIAAWFVVDRSPLAYCTASSRMRWSML